MPRYETKRDRKNEEVVAKAFCLNMNCTHKKIRELDDYSPDISLWRDGVRVAVAEIKVRTCARHHYPTYLISAGKINSLVERWTPTPIFLIVSWIDAICWVRVNDNTVRSWKLGMGGREDRGNPRDMERCYLIPIENFTRLNIDGCDSSE